LDLPIISFNLKVYSDGESVAYTNLSKERLLEMGVTDIYSKYPTVNMSTLSKFTKKDIESPFGAKVSLEKFGDRRLLIVLPMYQFLALEESVFKFLMPKMIASKKCRIILQPVKGGYLVLAKWGLEADDDLLVVTE